MAGQTNETDEVDGFGPKWHAEARHEQLVSLVDRVQRDRVFRAYLRRDPVAAAAGLGIELDDAEWHGLRDLLTG